MLLQETGHFGRVKASFSAGEAVSHVVKPRSSVFFRRVEASFGLNVLVLVLSGQSGVKTAVPCLFGRIKASFDLRVLVL